MTHSNLVTDPGAFLLQMAVCVVLTITGLLLGHYLPWRMMLGPEGLQRTGAYVWGCLWVLLPVTVGALVYGWGTLDLILGMWSSLLVGGAAVVGAYSADDYMAERASARERAELEKARMQ